MNKVYKIKNYIAQFTGRITLDEVQYYWVFEFCTYCGHIFKMPGDGQSLNPSKPECYT
jgi:hypothetical protein